MKKELLSLAEELDPMGERPYKDAIEATPEKAVEVFQYGMLRAFNSFESIGGDVVIQNIDDDGIIVGITRHHYARSCHVGSDVYSIDLTWAEILDSNCASIAEQKFQQKKRFEEDMVIEKQRRELAEHERRQQAARIAQMPNPY